MSGSRCIVWVCAGVVMLMMVCATRVSAAKETVPARAQTYPSGECGDCKPVDPVTGTCKSSYLPLCVAKPAVANTIANRTGTNHTNSQPEGGASGLRPCAELLPGGSEQAYFLAWLNASRVANRTQLLGLNKSLSEYTPAQNEIIYRYLPKKWSAEISRATCPVDKPVKMCCNRVQTAPPASAARDAGLPVIIMAGTLVGAFMLLQLL